MNLSETHADELHCLQKKKKPKKFRKSQGGVMRRYEPTPDVHMMSWSLKQEVGSQQEEDFFSSGSGLWWVPGVHSRIKSMLGAGLKRCSDFTYLSWSFSVGHVASGGAVQPHVVLINERGKRLVFLSICKLKWTNLDSCWSVNI